MGLIINDNISAINLLIKENIEVNSKNILQDIPRILIVNLMPKKKDTEYQLLKIIGNIHVDVKVDFLYTKTYKSKNTNLNYLRKAYKTLDQIKNIEYDGMIITGAPLEFLEFDKIVYWNELKAIMDYSNLYVKSTMYICWAVVAGLYYHYGIPKHITRKKVTGIFNHDVLDKDSLLFKNHMGKLWVPHSRYFEIQEDDIRHIDELEILSKSKEVGIYSVVQREGKQVYITGHPEYDTKTLKVEYERDLNKGILSNLPKNYFKNDDFKSEPKNIWENDSQRLFENWIRYYLM